VHERALPLATRSASIKDFRAIEFLSQASIAWMPTIQTINFTSVTYCCIHLSSRGISITLEFPGRDVTPLMRAADQDTSHAATSSSTLRTWSEHSKRCHPEITACPRLLNRPQFGHLVHILLSEKDNVTERLPLERRAGSRNRLQSDTAKMMSLA